MTKRKSLIAAFALAGALGACAGPHASGSYASHASYERLFAASLRAVSAVGYTVTSANKADGVIVAQQGVILGEGSHVGLNAMIQNEGGSRVLHVDFVAPPASLALGGFDSNLHQYINAVRAGVPDLVEASR